MQRIMETNTLIQTRCDTSTNTPIIIHKKWQDNIKEQTQRSFHTT